MTLTVTQCLEIINELFAEGFDELEVEGEVTDYRVIHNKWVTFSLKDEQSLLPCFMTVWQLKTQIEDGMVIKITGKPNIRAKGFFSYVVQTVTPVGEGALQRAFELLKQKLADEGLFAQERKRTLPDFPEKVALITSRQAAAYDDFIKVLQERQGGLHISFIHVQVQGQVAPEQIISAIKTANELDVDSIVLIRGGGSMEDLQAFNHEDVVRTVASSRVPTIVGIGHERDITLAELAADVRASTPSNAAQLLIQSREELVSSIESLTHRLRQRITAIHTEVSRVIERMQNISPRLKSEIANKQQHVQDMQRLLKSLSPENVLKRGFSIVTNKAGDIIKSANQVKPNTELHIQLATGKVKAWPNSHLKKDTKSSKK